MLILILLIVLLPVLAVQAGVYYRWFEAQRSETIQTNVEVARAVARAFDAFVQDVLHQEWAIGYVMTSGTLNSTEEQNQYLANSVQQFDDIRDYAWVDPQGRIVASSLPEAVGMDVRDRAYFQEISGGQSWAVNDIIQDRVTGKPIFIIARGIRDDGGNLQGIVVAVIDTGTLGNVLRIDRSTGSAVGVLDRHGTLVYRYPVVTLDWAQRDETGGRPGVAEAMRGEEWTGSFTSLLDGRERLAARSPIRSVGWIATASTPVDEAMAPVYSNLLQNIALLLAVSIGASGAAILTSRQLTKPLHRLRDHARASGRGDFDGRVEVDRPTELADLACAFNQMAADLRTREQERDELLNREQLARTAAETTSAQMAQFMHLIAHDVRQPITIARGHAQILKHILERGDVTRAKSSADAIDVATRRLDAMIRDLVDSARYEAGMIQLEREPIELASFISDLRDRIAALLDTERMHVEAAAPVIADADPNRLERILTNLLSNAEKYSDPGTEIVIYVEVCAGEAIVAVSDRGQGIPASVLPRLFERGFRVGTAVRKAAGMGLGLYITRLLVEAHGGRIWADSQEGTGTTFFFTLPLAKSTESGA